MSLVGSWSTGSHKESGVYKIFGIVLCSEVVFDEPGFALYFDALPVDYYQLFDVALGSSDDLAVVVDSPFAPLFVDFPPFEFFAARPKFVFALDFASLLRPRPSFDFRPSTVAVHCDLLAGMFVADLG